jgi:hypothetical protein
LFIYNVFKSKRIKLAGEAHLIGEDRGFLTLYSENVLKEIRQERVLI